MMNGFARKLAAFLASAEDESPSSDAENALQNLKAHDDKFHGGLYEKGMSCKYRESHPEAVAAEKTVEKNDKADESVRSAPQPPPPPPPQIQSRQQTIDETWQTASTVTKDGQGGLKDELIRTVGSVLGDDGAFEYALEPLDEEPGGFNLFVRRKDRAGFDDRACDSAVSALAKRFPSSNPSDVGFEAGSDQAQFYLSPAAIQDLRKIQEHPSATFAKQPEQHPRTGENSPKVSDNPDDYSRMSIEDIFKQFDVQQSEIGENTPSGNISKPKPKTPMYDPSYAETSISPMDSWNAWHPEDPCPGYPFRTDGQFGMLDDKRQREREEAWSVWSRRHPKEAAAIADYANRNNPNRRRKHRRGLYDTPSSAHEIDRYLEETLKQSTPKEPYYPKAKPIERKRSVVDGAFNARNSDGSLNFDFEYADTPEGHESADLDEWYRGAPNFLRGKSNMYDVSGLVGLELDATDRKTIYKHFNQNKNIGKFKVIEDAADRAGLTVDEFLWVHVSDPKNRAFGKIKTSALDELVEKIKNGTDKTAMLFESEMLAEENDRFSDVEIPTRTDRYGDANTREALEEANKAVEDYFRRIGKRSFE